MPDQSITSYARSHYLQNFCTYDLTSGKTSSPSPSSPRSAKLWFAKLHATIRVLGTGNLCTSDIGDEPVISLVAFAFPCSHDAAASPVL